MDFSEEWKSVWRVGSTYEAPLLISSESLGPLVFNPSSPQHILSSSISIPSLQHFILNYIHTTKNTHLVHILRCSSSSDFLLIFPTSSGEETLNHLAFVKFSLSFSEITITQQEIIQVAGDGFQTEITRISVSALHQDEAYLLLAASNASSCVHWHRVDIHNLSSSTYLGMDQFLVESLCWNPHLPQECLVLSQTGDLLLRDLQHFCSSTSTIPWQDDSPAVSSSWLGCHFSWHPRIFVVASCTAVFLVDWRPDQRKVSIVAQIDIFHCFTAFSMVPPSNGFQFTVASQNYLFLVDIRKPLAPLLQWAHQPLHTPDYINVLRLSDLRSNPIHTHDDYKHASDSGFAIILGSFSSCHFTLFCYGPSFPPPKDGSVASTVSKLCSSLYAWELPSEISMLGRRCNCGDCLVRQELSKAVIPQWEKQQILGFMIVRDAVGDEDSSGFTLIRLVSTGKLEAQRYLASWNSCTSCSKSQESSTSLDLLIGEEYKFQKRFRYLKLEALMGFMKSGLSEVLVSKRRSANNAKVGNTMVYTPNSCKRVYDVLSDVGVDVTGVNGINWPMSIHEMTSRKLWGGLDRELLQLAFTENSKLVEVAVDHRKISLAAVGIPRMPSFFLKKTDLVGPLLPLPYLLTLEAEGRNIFSYLSDECCKMKTTLVSSSNPNEKPPLLFHKPSGPAVVHEVDTFLCKPRQDNTTSKPVGLDFFHDVCPIELNFDVPHLTFASEELEGYKVLKTENLKWQKSVGQWQELSRSLMKTKKPVSS